MIISIEILFFEFGENYPSAKSWCKEIDVVRKIARIAL